MDRLETKKKCHGGSATPRVTETDVAATIGARQLHNGDLPRWIAKVKSVGLWERYQERIQIELRLKAQVEAEGIMSEIEHDPQTGTRSLRLEYDEWLRVPEYFDDPNFCSCPRLVLKQFDKWLWENEPVTLHEDTITGYEFSYADVVALLTAGEITTQGQWDRLVENRYRAAWEWAAIYEDRLENEYLDSLKDVMAH